MKHKTAIDGMIIKKTQKNKTIVHLGKSFPTVKYKYPPRSADDNRQWKGPLALQFLSGRYLTVP